MDVGCDSDIPLELRLKVLIAVCRYQSLPKSVGTVLRYGVILDAKYMRKARLPEAYCSWYMCKP